jgi:hypothetical protein
VQRRSEVCSVHRHPWSLVLGVIPVQALVCFLWKASGSTQSCCVAVAVLAPVRSVGVSMWAFGCVCGRQCRSSGCLV